MAKKLTSQKDHSAEEIDNAARVAAIFSSSELIELINNRWRFAWINFRAGLYRGVGTTVGIALTIVLISYLVILLGGLPYIGDFVRDVQQGTQVSPSAPRSVN